MTWDDGLSESHREIAGSDARRLGALAGPGTGKTTFGLIRRVVRLLETGVPGNRILLISFTRVAAADLRDKVAELEAEGADSVRATTLHSFCFSLLLKHDVLAITRRVPRILLDHEADLMLRDIGGNFGTIYDRRKRLEAMLAGWARGDEDYAGLPTDPTDRDFAALTRQWLLEHRAMLIGEVVPIAYNYLVTNPQAPELSSYDHIIVDEYQDLNRLEQQLLDVLADRGSLCVAGDDDQSIYSVRYANPRGILEFLERAGVQSATMDICGRCPRRIVDMANSLIRQAPDRHKGDLRCGREDAGTVAIVQWPDISAEIDGIVSAIAADVGSERRQPGDILMLTNWRKLGEGIRARLTDAGIPVRSFFTEEELKTTAAREALALLQLLVHRDDRPALRVLLGLEDQEGRSAAYRRALSFAREHNVPVGQLLRRLSEGERLGPTIPALVDRYRRTQARLDDLDDLGIEPLIDLLLPDDNEALADLRAAALAAATETDSTEDLLRLLIEAVTQDEVPQHPDFVRVMSLHKSKGLTSPVVYVVGAIDGVLPTIPTDDVAEIQAGLEEGRRLFYVALTRASDELLISSSSQMDLADANARKVKYNKNRIRNIAGRHVVPTIASPYLAELGARAPRATRGTEWLAGR